MHPVPLSKRVHICLEELLNKIKSAHASTNPNAIDILREWAHTMLVVSKMLEINGLTDDGKLLAELQLIECYRVCGTSCDIRGLLFINIYVHDRKPHDGKFKDVCVPHQTILIQQERAQPAYKEWVEKVTLWPSPRPLTREDGEDDFCPRYEVRLETKPAIDIGACSNVNPN